MKYFCIYYFLCAMKLSQKPSNKPRSKKRVWLRKKVRQKNYVRKRVKQWTKKWLDRIKVEIETKGSAKNLQLEVQKEYQKRAGTGWTGDTSWSTISWSWWAKTSWTSGKHKKVEIDKTIQEEMYDAFHAQWLDTTSIDLEEFTEEYEDLRNIFGGKIPWAYITKIYKKYVRREKRKKEQANKEKKWEKLQEELLDLDGIFAEAMRQQLLNDCQEMNETENVSAIFLRQTDILQFLFNDFSKLSLSQKKELLTMLTWLLEAFKEGVLIEIYEIHIDPATGTIRISGTQGTQTISLAPLWKKNLKKIQNFLEK